MDSWTIFQLYGLVSVALGATSYFTLYRPAVELVEQILDEELPIYRGWFGTSLWLIIATLGSPVSALVLLSNNNDRFITDFALKLADRVIDTDEDDE